MTGIYLIQSKSNPERVYVGSAVDISQRIRVHLNRLHNNKHHSKKLQNHFNKYGNSDLTFSILESCKPHELLDREQRYIDAMKPWFNICPKAGNTLGATWTLSEDAKKNISEGHKGLKHSEESKRKRSEALKGKQPSDLARKRSSEVHKGQILQPHQLDALKKKRTGNQYAKGKHWKLSEETKAKMREAAIRNNNASRFNNSGNGTS